LITWLTGLPVVLSTQAGLVHNAHVLPHPLAMSRAVAELLLAIGTYGPALAALAVTAVESGRVGVRALLRQTLRWWVGLHWFVLALLGPSLITLLAVGLYAGVSGRAPAQWLLVPTPIQLVLLVTSLWGEEIGWRGYALPRLQGRWSALGASLLVGVLWFVWGNWPLVTPAGPPTIDVGGLAATLVFLLSAAVLFAWLYNSTRGSLPIAWAAHVGIDLNLVASQQVPYAVVAALFAVAAILVVVLAGPRTLARARPVG
jgi:membrane protease YdiL (CAAX protease family)